MLMAFAISTVHHMLLSHISCRLYPCCLRAKITMATAGTICICIRIPSLQEVHVAPEHLVSSSEKIEKVCPHSYVLPTSFLADLTLLA